MDTKPVRKKIEYYDYNECRDYLEKKYGYEERDYASKYNRDHEGKIKNINEDQPYLDFWHWVVENYEIHNGCDLTFYKEKLNEIQEEWVKEIYSKYIEEFADEEGNLEMKVYW